MIVEHEGPFLNATYSGNHLLIPQSFQRKKTVLGMTEKFHNTTIMLSHILVLDIIPNKEGTLPQPVKDNRSNHVSYINGNIKNIQHKLSPERLHKYEREAKRKRINNNKMNIAIIVIIIIIIIILVILTIKLTITITITTIIIIILNIITHTHAHSCTMNTTKST